MLFCLDFRHYRKRSASRGRSGSRSKSRSPDKRSKKDERDRDRSRRERSRSRDRRRSRSRDRKRARWVLCAVAYWQHMSDKERNYITINGVMAASGVRSVCVYNFTGSRWKRWWNLKPHVVFTTFSMLAFNFIRFMQFVQCYLFYIRLKK